MAHVGLYPDFLGLGLRVWISGFGSDLQDLGSGVLALGFRVGPRA